MQERNNIVCLKHPNRGLDWLGKNLTTIKVDSPHETAIYGFSLTSFTGLYKRFRGITNHLLDFATGYI